MILEFIKTRNISAVVSTGADCRDCLLTHTSLFDAYFKDQKILRILYKLYLSNHERYALKLLCTLENDGSNYLLLFDSQSFLIFV